MNKETQIKILKVLDAKNLEILNKKGEDYASADVLSNFKRLSTAAKAMNLNMSTPESYAMFMVLLKIDRINNLISEGKKPGNESLEDSFIDAIAYMKLAYLCHVDQEYKL